MKVAIVAPSGVPYSVGGAEKLWWGMLQEINANTRHEVELLKIPSPEKSFWQVVDSYRKFHELDLSHFDCVISTKYPAWMVRHPNHIIYLQHKLRGLYDTYPDQLPTGLESVTTLMQQLPQGITEALNTILRLLKPETSGAYIPSSKVTHLFDALEVLQKEYDSLPVCSTLESIFVHPGPLLRNIVHWLDSAAMQPDRIQKYLAISQNVASRNEYFPKSATVHVVHHPSGLSVNEPTGKSYIFTVSRLDSAKRLDLLIKAMKFVVADVELRIAGDGPMLDVLQALANDDHRIRFLGRLSDAEIARQYSGAIFIPFIPYDEDLGLITIEAMMSGKPVLTATDSGGVNEFVEDGVSGWSVAPDVESLADGIRRMLDDPKNTERMGELARDKVAHISWQALIDALFAMGDDDAVQQRPSLVVAVTFPVFPPRGGGQQRIFHLYRNLARYMDVTIITLGYHDSVRQVLEISSGLTLVCIPKSYRHHQAELQLADELNASVGDLYAMEYIDETPDYVSLLSEYLSSADIAVASHHYLYTTIRRFFSGPLIYEAHNVEADMKLSVLAPDGVVTHKVEKWLDKVKSLEQACCMDAAQIVTCCYQDALRLSELYDHGTSEIISKCLTISNGTDLDSVTFADHSIRQRFKYRQSLEDRFICLFIGSWHRPNIDAVRCILKIARDCPEIDFWIAGSVCDYPFYSDSRDWPENVYRFGIISTEEKSVILQTVDLALNPVISGAGTNLKILEYAAAGIPILTTQYGCRGSCFEDGSFVWLSDMDDFAQGIIKLSQEDMTAWQAHLKSASEAVRKSYGWGDLSRTYFTMLKAWVSKEHTSDDNFGEHFCYPSDPIKVG